ncbi:XdhC family protein [Nocardia thailandica]
MRAILPPLLDALDRAPVALARIVDRTGSGPRDTGSAMAVTASGTVLGSLSGGCLEAAVVATAEQVLADRGSALERFAATGEFGVGLPCGGEIEVFTEYLDRSSLALLRELDAAVAAATPVALVTTLEATPDRTLLYPGDPRPWRHLDRDAAARLASGRDGIVGSEDTAGARPRAFVQVFAPPPRMILAGANDFTRALAVTAAQLGYHVTVVDARETFTTAARFPAAHEVVVDWPHRYLDAERAAGRLDGRTVVCVLTHDPKFDVPTLISALGLPELAFLGALGSRRTHDDRLARLRAEGVSDSAVARIHSPLGLDLNAHTPEETAISIAAQIVAVRGGGTGRALSTEAGPIHHRRRAPWRVSES